MGQGRMGLEEATQPGPVTGFGPIGTCLGKQQGLQQGATNTS